MNLENAYTKANSRIIEIITGSNPGITTGFPAIDDKAGTMHQGQLWVVGGYSGIGKSYFILNMLNNILRDNPKTTIAVYSTELLVEDYMRRHMLMNAGIWANELKNSPDIERLDKSFTGYHEEFVESERLGIFGGIAKWEEILQNWHNPSVAIIDFVQELGIGKLTDVKDTMPLITAQLKSLALVTGCTILAVSQLSNTGHREKQKERIVAPFDYGKELNRAAHTSMILSRKKLDGGKHSMLMDVEISKAREGETGTVQLLIQPGFRLIQPVAEQVIAIKQAESKLLDDWS